MKPMALIKKLNLSDFLAQSNITETEQTFQLKEDERMSYNLSDFYSIISEHSGVFIINDKLYTSIIPSMGNLYFFKESSNDEFILLFDPIIDIKKKDDNNFVVFYYPDKIINILLKDSVNVKEITKSSSS